MAAEAGLASKASFEIQKLPPLSLATIPAGVSFGAITSWFPRVKRGRLRAA